MAVKELPADRQVPKVGLTVEEAAWSLGVSETKIYRMMSEGKLPVCKVGGNSLVDPEDLRVLLRKCKMLRNQ